MKKFIKYSAISLIASSVLVGCGSSSTADSPTVISGNAVDGYLAGSTICLDLSGDGTCQTDEPTTETGVTGEDGSFSLVITDAHKADGNFTTAPLIVYGGEDLDNPGIPFDGPLTAPNATGGEVYITPVTTMIEAMMGGTVTQEEAEANVKIALGLGDVDNIYGDPVAQSENGDNTLYNKSVMIHTVVKELAKAKDGAESGEALDLDTMKNLYIELGELIKNAETPDFKTVTEELILKDGNITIIGDVVNFSMFEEPAAVKPALVRATVGMTAVDAKAIIDAGVQNAHAKELIVIAYGYMTSDALATNVQRVLEAAGATDEKWLSPEDEIVALKADETTNALALKLEIKFASFQETMDETKDLLSSDILNVDLPFSWYEIYSHDNNIEYEKITLGSDSKVTFEESEFKDGSWVLDDEDDSYALINGSWVSATSGETFVKNDDGTFTADDGNLTVLSKSDIGNKTIEVENLVVNMPSGAEQYSMKFEPTEDRYELFHKANYWNQDTYSEVEATSFKDVIENQCGYNSFMGNYDGGLAFAGTQDTDNEWSYNCDGNATSGKLFEVKYVANNSPEIVSTDAGTWKIDTIDGQKILKVTPTDPIAYSYDNFLEYTIFAPVTDENNNTALYRGSMEPKGEVETFKGYNETALTAIKNAYEQKINGIELGGDMYGESWTVVTKDERYSRFLITPDEEKQLVKFEVGKIDGQDSRGEVKTDLLNDSVEVKLGVKITDADPYAKVQLIAQSKSVSTTSQLSGLNTTNDLMIHAGVSLYFKAIGAWVSIEDNNGNEHNFNVPSLLDFNTTIDSIMNKKVIMNVKLVEANSKIEFSVNDTNGTLIGSMQTFDLATNGITLGNTIQYTKVRTRIDDRDKDGLADNYHDIIASNISATVFGFTSDGTTPVNTNITND